MQTKADYPALEREFITTDTSLRSMAKREGISNGTLSEKARRPDANGKTWLQKRQDYQDDVARRYLRSSAESRARQLADLGGKAVDVLEAIITRLAIQIVGDPKAGVAPMEIPVKEGLEAIRQIQALRGQATEITEERKIVGHLADPRLLDALGELARRTLRPEPVDVSPPRALPDPVERSA